MADVEHRLARLRELPVNFDPDGADPDDGSWRTDSYREPLPSERPGPPLADGTFAHACRLLRDYRLADPSMVRAYYHEQAPLEGRDMLLELRFLGISQWVGCRVGPVTDERRLVDGREVQVWGWPYRTLEGHIERGEMSWQIWKWLDSGEVEFRITAFSRIARIRNPLVALGFRVIGQRERRRYLVAACQRMRELVESAGE